MLVDVCMPIREALSLLLFRSEVKIALLIIGI